MAFANILAKGFTAVTKFYVEYFAQIPQSHIRQTSAEVCLLKFLVEHKCQEN